MKNYYELLNIPKTASYNEIKTAYRLLAKKYHPDKNPNSPHTEELFKQISVAYDPLSSPAKKSRYDAILSYQEFQPVTPTQNNPHYQTYTKPRPKQYKKPETTSYYGPSSWINLNTKKFIAVLCLATLFVFGIIGLANYVQYQEQEALKQKYLAKYQLYYSTKTQVEKHFSEGNYTACLLAANEMSETLYQFIDAEEFQKDIQAKIEEAGITHLEQNEYPQAVNAFETLFKLGNKINDLDLLNYHLGLAYYNNQVEDAINLLSNFETEYNPEIPTLVAIIYRDYYKNTEEALKWHRNAKQILSVIYRNVGFQFTPSNAPEGHFEAYYQSALTSYNLKDYKTALQDLRGALFLRSANRDALFMKGLCEVELGYGEACVSFEKAKNNGHILADEMLAKRCR